MGVGSDGVLQIWTGKNCCPGLCGTYTATPTPRGADLLSAQVGRMDMSPDQGVTPPCQCSG